MEKEDKTFNYALFINLESMLPDFPNLKRELKKILQEINKLQTYLLLF
jgi:hypothetical protein